MPEAIDRIDWAALRHAHGAPARIDDAAAVGIVGRIRTHVLRERHVHAFAIELLGFGQVEQVFEHAAPALGCRVGAHELEAVAAIVDPDAELALDLAQVLVELPAHARQSARIVGREHNGE